MEALFALIKDLVAKKFYGKIEINMEAGRIVLIRKSETLKIGK